MATMCFFLGIVLVQVVSIVKCLYSDGDTQYGVILDAGSSGTKVKIYSWAKLRDLSEVPVMDLLYGKKFRPGVGHFAKRPEGLSPYLYDMITNATEHVPASQRSSTPIYLMATAGARILDGNIALGLLQRIRNIFSNKTINPFRFRGHNVRILSGEEEGVFAWIALNALTGFFNSSRSKRESYGLLEMGGGSTQIAFVPYMPIYAGEFQVMLWRRLYDIYVHSYLFYGANYIRQRVNNYLVWLNPGSDHITHPCRLTGDDVSVNVNGESVTFLGASDPMRCMTILRRLTSRVDDEECYPKPCAIGSVYQPSVGNTTFYATQAFTYTPQKLHSLDEHRRLNLTKLQDEAVTYCRHNLTQAKADYDVSDEYASNECLIGLYIPILLLDRYDLDPDNTKVIVSNKVHGNRIDWTMGAMLYEINIKFQSQRLLPRTNIPCVNNTVVESADVPLPSDSNEYQTGRSNTTSGNDAQGTGSTNSTYISLPPQTVVAEEQADASPVKSGGATPFHMRLEVVLTLIVIIFATRQ